MGIFQRQLWKQKPQAWGPFSAVQSALFHNLELFYGIDYRRCTLANFMWNPGDQRDLSRYARLGAMVGDGVVFEKNQLSFTSAVDGTADRINLGSIPSSDPLSCYASQELTIAVGLRYDGSTRNAFPRIIDKSTAGSGAGGWYFGYQTTSNYLQFYTNGSLNNNFNGAAQSILEDLKHHDLVLSVKDNLQILADYGKIIESQTSPSISFPATTANVAIGNWNHSTDRNWLGDMRYLFAFDVALDENQAGKLGENPYQAFQPVPQKTIFLPMDQGGNLPINVTGSCSFSGEVTRKVLYNRSVEGEI